MIHKTCLNLRPVLIVFLLLVTFNFLLAAPVKFKLEESDSQMLGADNGKLVMKEGQASHTVCEVEGNEIMLKTMSKFNKEVIQEKTYDYMYVSETDIGIASSKSGNIKYFFDFSNQYYSHGQVNILLSKGMIITKSTMGKIVLYEND